MRRTGLHESHVRDFQNTALAACGACRYEGLYPEDGLADREDLEGVVARIYALERDHAGGMSVVDLAVLVHDLREAVTRDLETPAPRARERARQAALVYARAALAACLAGNQLRWCPGATLIWEENARFLETHFGAYGLGGRLTPVGQRIAGTWFRAHTELSEAAAAQLLELSRAAAAQGQKREAARASIRAAHVLGEAGAAGAYAAVRVETARHLRVAMDTDGDGVIHVGHLDLAWAALGSGEVDEAERMLDAFERWCRAPWTTDMWWQGTRWWTLAERGAYRAAAEFLSRAEAPAAESPLLWRLCEMGARGKRITWASHCREIRQMMLRNALAGTGVPPAPLPAASPW
jgi:hypothetical protein